MLLKTGVSLKGLNRECRRALYKLEKMYPDFVLTSTTEGLHLPSSLHYAGDAIDVRLSYPFKWRGLNLEEIREALGPGFDVIKEPTHFHIEWDPK